MLRDVIVLQIIHKTVCRGGHLLCLYYQGYVNASVAKNSAWPWLRLFLAGIPPQKTGFSSGAVHVGFVVDKITLRQVLLQILRFPLSISFHRHSPFSHDLEDEQLAC
jgi:hypothetical protein